MTDQPPPGGSYPPPPSAAWCHPAGMSLRPLRSAPGSSYPPPPPPGGGSYPPPPPSAGGYAPPPPGPAIRASADGVLHAVAHPGAGVPHRLRSRTPSCIGIGVGIMLATQQTTCVTDVTQIRRQPVLRLPSPRRIGMLVQWVASLVGLAYLVWNYGYRQGTTGSSIGKSVMKFKVVSEITGQPIGFGMSVVRQIAHFVDAIICLHRFPVPAVGRQAANAGRQDHDDGVPADLTALTRTRMRHGACHGCH